MYDYTKRIRLARLKVGIVVTLGICGLIVGLLFAGGIGDLFTEKTKIYAVFQNVQGLRPGAPVRFAGMEIGRVRDMQFDPASRIRVSLSIRAQILKYLTTDSRAQLLTLGLLGDRYVAITPGSPQGDPLKPGGILPGELDRGFSDVVAAAERVIGRVDAFIQKFGNVFDKLDIEEGSLTRLLSDPEVFLDFKQFIRESADVLKKINDGSGSLGMLINDDGVYREIRSAARRIANFGAKLNSSQGSLHKLISDPVLYKNLSQAMQNLAELTQEINTGKGSFAQLLRDERLYENLESLTASLDQLLTNVNAGQGLLGQLTQDERFYKELQGTVRELNRLIQDIRANPGKYFDFDLF